MAGPSYRYWKGFGHYRNPLSLLHPRSAGLSAATVTDPKTGLRFNCRDGADRIMAETFHSRIHDVPFAPVRGGDVVLDIGANQGFYACWAAHHGATVHAFEPDPDTFSLMVENIFLNDLEGRITVHQCAISDQTGQVRMFRAEGPDGPVNTINPAFAVIGGIHGTRQTTVQALSLADALDRVGADRVRLCKLDCTGAEYSILASLTPRMLDRFDALTLQYHPQAYELSDLIDLLLGWERFHISQAINREPDLRSANLSAVRSELIRQWCDATTIAQRRDRMAVDNVAAAIR